MEKLNDKQHLFFSLFSEAFFGKRLRTVQRPKGGAPQAPKNTKKKALKKTALRLMSFFPRRSGDCIYKTEAVFFLVSLCI
jgi:hypothetical protein